MPDKCKDRSARERAERDAPHEPRRARAAIVLAPLVVAIALTATGCGSGSSRSPAAAATTTSAAAAELAAEARTAARTEAASASAMPAATRAIDRLLGGIPQSGAFLGSPAAPVTLQFFSDVICPASREITLGPLVPIIRRWVRSGRLRIELRAIEEGTEPKAVVVHQQVAALAAGEQNRLWQYVEYLYQTLEAMGPNYTDTCHAPSERFLQTIAQRVPGLEAARWRADLQDQRLIEQAEADPLIGARLGTRYPHHEDPAYLIERTGTNKAMQLSRFAHVDPAYAKVISELLAVHVTSG